MSTGTLLIILGITLLAFSGKKDGNGGVVISGKYGSGDVVEVFILGGWTVVTVLSKDLVNYDLIYGKYPDVDWNNRATFKISDFDKLKSRLVDHVIIW